MSDSNLPSEYSQPASDILHATDFKEQSDVALAHALRLALSTKAHLTLLHVDGAKGDRHEDFPSIREFLQRWGVIPQGAPRSAVTEQGIGIEKVVGVAGNVVESIAGYCDRRPIDMVVLATAGRDGVAAWLKPSKAEQIAEKVATLSIPTLFVPAGGRGCVDIASGAVSMDRVLVPVDHQPASDTAVERGLRAIAMFGGEQGTLSLLHVGSQEKFPEVRIPEGPWQVERVARKGNPAAEIVAAAEESQANLIIMVTEGTHGFLDVLRGTTTEQVLRHAPCPVLAVPA